MPSVDTILGRMGQVIGDEGDGSLQSVIAGNVQVRASAGVTATSDGLTTGLIPAGTSFVPVTSDSSAKKVSLPAGTIGDVIELQVGSTACKLIAVTAADKANNVTIGATNALTLAANCNYTCEYYAANNWRVTGTKLNGAPVLVSTAALTTITIADSAGTPDYALSALTTTSPYGLATQAEAISLLYVIQNLQVRLAELEAGTALIPA